MNRETHFRSRIRTALADPDLQKALDGNADRRQKAFTQAYASLPRPLPVMRQEAHAVRAETIAHLDDYLEEFIANAQANGLIIHHATDAHQATEIVCQIARQANARTVAKSKSMVSEEVHLNQALEAQGVTVVETDLGEYIVQLRGEPPAHIITPAVHINRSEVGKTFEEKLNLPYTEDIPTLTAAARAVLRQIFLDAEIGVSGVNFGIAETGGLCIITNEGNGRMVTTMPDIHIALMGIERLLPTLDDLATLLYLLPRSATGQKLTVYTNLIHSPRRAGETDGPRERHLILLDNGRRALRDSSLAEALYCIRCGACLNACPVFREIGGHSYVGAHNQNSPYPGPIGSVISPGLFGSAEFGHLARASSLCGACKDACPVDINLPALLLRIRADAGVSPPAQSSATGRSSATSVPGSLNVGLRIFAWIAASPGRFAAAQRLAGWASRLLAPRSGWLRLPDFSGWGYQRDFPRPATRPFRERFAQNHQRQTTNTPGQRKRSTGHSAAESSPESRPDAIARFETELNALGGEVSHAAAEALFEKMLAFLQEEKISKIQAWDADQLPDDLLDKLGANGIQIVHEADPSIRAGLTGALGGIAETGTLIIPGGPGRPQTASLLPEIHIVILEAKNLYSDMTQALRQGEIRSASNSVLISGPSRTADIEMTLTIGVHGPRRVHVFCI